MKQENKLPWINTPKIIEVLVTEEILTYEVSDDVLESAAGDMRIVACSCGRCSSACSQGSK